MRILPRDNYLARPHEITVELVVDAIHHLSAAFKCTGAAQDSEMAHCLVSSCLVRQAKSYTPAAAATALASGVAEAAEPAAGLVPQREPRRVEPVAQPERPHRAQRLHRLVPRAQPIVGHARVQVMDVVKADIAGECRARGKPNHDEPCRAASTKLHSSPFVQRAVSKRRSR